MVVTVAVLAETFDSRMELMLSQALTLEIEDERGRKTEEPFLAAVRATIRYAYQPIVNITSGASYGFEALLRGQQGLGFPTIASLFDYAHEQGLLHRLELTLRELAIQGFLSIKATRGCRLFFNLDNRVLDAPDYRPHRTTDLLRHYGLEPTCVCFELSELHAVPDQAGPLLRRYRDQSYLLAIDDFGVGFSGLRLLYDHQPNVIKLDRFFIDQIDEDSRKRTFASSVVSLAHILGMAVVAEGVETERAFLTCKAIGCDLVQGYFIARPTVETSELRETYEAVAAISRRDRRHSRSDEKLVRVEVDPVPALRAADPMGVVFDTFRRNKDRNFFPVIDENRLPLGVVRESELKEFIYSRYGKDLLSNKTLGRNLRNFLTACPICDINTEVETILAIYSQAEDPPCVIIVENFRYVGILSAASLLRVLNDKNLRLARNQNPLTKLPGNDLIADHISLALDDRSAGWIFVYFDLDNFKPFNDLFGFRQGDRAILMFADLLTAHLTGADAFVGHIGGDDFFASRRTDDPEAAIAEIRALVETFGRDAEMFYDPETRQRGHVEGRDREGQPRRYPLLSCSAAITVVPAGDCTITLDQVSEAVADMKRLAKRSPDHLCIRWVGKEG